MADNVEVNNITDVAVQEEIPDRCFLNPKPKLYKPRAKSPPPSPKKRTACSGAEREVCKKNGDFKRRNTPKPFKIDSYTNTVEV